MSPNLNAVYKTLAWLVAALAIVLVVMFGLKSANAADVYSRTSAKDTLVQSAPVSAEKIWTSLWAAALAGYTMSNTDLGLDSLYDDKFTRQATVQGFGGEGFDGTLQLGGDVQVGALTLGGWAEYSFGGSQAGVGLADIGKLEVDQSDSSCAFGRLGLPRGNTLWYTAGGYCWTTFEARLIEQASIEKRKLDLDGPAAELGVEHRFSDNLRAKLSGRYEFYNEETVLQDEHGRIKAQPGELRLRAGIVLSTGDNMAGLLGN